MNIYGFGYKLSCTSSPQLGTSRELHITFTWMRSTDATGFVRLPRTWKFPVNSIDGFEQERFGTSETRGWFGGIKNKAQEHYSELCERAIGEVLTVMLCEVLDEVSNDPGQIIILGPSLPKVVGRIAALRPPAKLSIKWICPKPMPDWIAEGASEIHLLPKYPLRDTSAKLAGDEWEDESIISGYTYRPKMDGANSRSDACIVQQFDMWENAPDYGLETLHWIRSGARLCEGVLPRELPMAAGQVQVHVDEPYVGEPEEGFRNEQAHDIMPIAPYEPESPLRQHARAGSPLGWNIHWKDNDN